MTDLSDRQGGDTQMFKCNCPHETRSGCAEPACPHYVKPREPLPDRQNDGLLPLDVRIQEARYSMFRLLRSRASYESLREQWRKLETLLDALQPTRDAAEGASTCYLERSEVRQILMILRDTREVVIAHPDMPPIKFLIEHPYIQGTKLERDARAAFLEEK